MSEIGHNSTNPLRAVIERLERLENDKKAIAEDIKDVYAEAKSNGYDPAALRVIVRLMLEDASKKAKREEREATVDTYKAAVGIA